MPELIKKDFENLQIPNIGKEPRGQRAQRLRKWLTILLRPGTIHIERLENRFELRMVTDNPNQQIFTHINSIAKAAVTTKATVEKAIEELKKQHWIDTSTDRVTFLGPRRFKASITERNFLGPIGTSTEISVLPWLNLSNIDRRSLLVNQHIVHKKILDLERGELNSTTVAWILDGTSRLVPGGESLLLEAGSKIRMKDWCRARLADSITIEFRTGRTAVVEKGGKAIREDDGVVGLEKGETVFLESGSPVVLQQANCSGCLEVKHKVQLNSGAEVDWMQDSGFLGEFQDNTPVVFLRRAIFGVMEDVVLDAPDGKTWRILIGLHETLLDGMLPHRKQNVPAEESTEKLKKCLQATLPNEEGLRRTLEREFNHDAPIVNRYDTRIGSFVEASDYDMEQLRRVVNDPEVNQEQLYTGSNMSIWRQLGAYYLDKHDWRPIEVCREIYPANDVETHFVGDQM